MKITKIIVILLFVPVLFMATTDLKAQQIGVGVTTGTIRIEEPLMPGGTYYLPSVGVVNTGEVASDYMVRVTFHADQKELWPSVDWFSFSPQRFHSEPGKSQAVRVVLSLPVKMQPGDYFAYFEASPARETGPGTAIGIAAATKLYFTVAPANIFQGIYYKFVSWYSQYHPWNTIVLVIIFAAILITIFRKKFKIQIARK